MFINIIVVWNCSRVWTIEHGHGLNHVWTEVQNSLQHYKTKNKLIALYAYDLLLSRRSTIFLCSRSSPLPTTVSITSVAADFTLYSLSHSVFYIVSTLVAIFYIDKEFDC